LEEFSWWYQWVFIIGVMLREHAIIMIGFCFMDSGPIISGLSYNGKDENGNDRLDRTPNLEMVKMYTSCNISQMLRYWNMSTQTWLKYYVFLRMLGPPVPAGEKRKAPGLTPMFITFGVSAIWHGFYTGYMLFFMMAGYTSWQTTLAQRNVMPRVNALGIPGFVSYFVAWVYLWLNTAYWVVPFYLLNWDRYDKVLASMNYSLHYVTAGVTIFLLIVQTLCPPKREKKTHTE